MDHLTKGRVLLGIGTSNPQVTEGWYGQPYPRPLERTREYVDILRKVIARAEPVSYDGRHYRLPLPTGTGLGKPLRPILHPYRTEIPVYLRPGFHPSQMGSLDAALRYLARSPGTQPPAE